MNQTLHSLSICLVFCFVFYGGIVKITNVSAQPNHPTTSINNTKLAHPEGKLPWDPKVRRGQLPNKMRYLIEANKHPAGRAELRLVVDVGSVLEDPDQLGLAHFVEHMAFNGSEHFKGNQLVETLESFGMKFGAHLNAYTSFDETVYQLQIPTDPDKLKIALQILRDWAGGISFDPEEIEKERGVVLDEWRGSLGAGQRIQDKLIPLQFNHSHYASRLPIGTEISLTQFKPDQLIRFYRDWYRPELMTLIAVGDFDVDQLESEIKTRLSDLQNPTEPRSRTLFPIQPYKTQISEVFVDPELPTIALQLSELRAHRDPTTRGSYRSDYIGDLAIQILNERLGDLRKQAKPPFMYAMAYQYPLTAYMETRGLMIAPFENQLSEAIDATITELRKIQVYGITQSELDRAQRVLLSQLDQAIKEERTEESEAAAAELVRHVTRGEPVPGLTSEAALIQEIAPTVSVIEINDSLKTLLSSAGWCATLMGPQTATWLPEKDALKDMIHKALQKKVEPIQQTQAQVGAEEAPLVPQPPQSGEIKKETVDPITGATIWELSNGVKVVLKSTDFEDNTILLSGFKWGGTSTVAEVDYIPASQASSLAMSSGLGSWTATTLPKRLAGIQATSSLSISELEVSISGSSTLRDLEIMFELLWLRATASRIDEEVFDNSLRAQKEELSRRDLQPTTAFYDAYQRSSWDDHPRRQPMSQSEIEQADLNRSRELLKSLTADWSGATFILVGKLDLAVLKPKVAQWIGGLPTSSMNLTSKKDALGFKDIGARLTRKSHTQVMHRGMEPKALVVMSLHGDFENTPQQRYLFRSLNELLSTRLREVLREREGGTYSVGAQGDLIEKPAPEYAITISFGCDPKRAEELSKLAWAEVKRLKGTLASVEEIQKITEIQRRDHEVNIKRNAYWLGALGSNLSRDEPSSALAEYWSLHDTLTPEKLHQAALRYLKDSPTLHFTLLPEAKTETQTPK